jgi:erythromycin esterase-like protein
MRSSENIIGALTYAGRSLLGTKDDYDYLLELIGDARLVLLGEATHGTHEFYRERAQITKRLIAEKGFTAVAVEADWPDAYRVNRYVRGQGTATDADDALAGFKRFPIWMWRNTEVREFVDWLRRHNERTRGPELKAGFYGLDLYSLYGSMEAVLAYLEKVDSGAAKRARYRYSCFDQFGEDSQAYGYAATFGLTESCEREVVNQLHELQRRATDYANRDGRVAADDFFFAEQNARLVKDAEEYYREMFRGSESSWNLRDRHMADTLEHLIAFLTTQGPRPKIVVWEHNSHIGDARATEMTDRGEVNVGQLVRERYKNEAVSIGFTTYHGTVTAATDWDGPAECKRIRPALEGSYEALFHNAGPKRFLIDLRDHGLQCLREPRLERAIGVVYRPQSERISHYFKANLPAQFDAVLHFDETRALQPLEPAAGWESDKEAADTYPSGL